MTAKHALSTWIAHTQRRRAVGAPAHARTVLHRPGVLALVAGVVVLAAVAGFHVIRGLVGDATPMHGVYMNDIVRMVAYDGLALPPRMAPAWDPHTADRWLPRRARAVRIGARHVDAHVLADLRLWQAQLAYYGGDSLALTLVARSADHAAALSADNARDLSRLPGGDSAATLYAAATREAVDRDFWGPPLWAAGRHLPPKYAPYVVLGAWLEGARVAAQRGDASYFQRQESQAVVSAMVQLPRLSRAQRAALERVRRLLTTVSYTTAPGGGSAQLAREELDVLTEELTQALAVLAN